MLNWKRRTAIKCQSSLVQFGADLMAWNKNENKPRFTATAQRGATSSVYQRCGGADDHAGDHAL